MSETFRFFEHMHFKFAKSANMIPNSVLIFKKLVRFVGDYPPEYFLSFYVKWYGIILFGLLLGSDPDWHNETGGSGSESGKLTPAPQHSLFYEVRLRPEPPTLKLK